MRSPLALALALALLALILAGCLDLDALQSGRGPASAPQDASSALLDASADLPPPDLAPAPVGCLSGRGRVVSPNMHACAGAWAAGQGPGALCSAGWSWCATNPVSADACQAALPSDELYLAKSPISQPGPYPWGSAAKCSWDAVPPSGLRGISGCGNGLPGLDGPPNVSPCGGWPLVAICWQGGAGYPGSPISCPWSMASDGDLSNVLNGNPARVGALCCQ